MPSSTGPHREVEIDDLPLCLCVVGFQSGDIEVLMGVSAEGVNTEEKMIHLSTGDTVSYEKLFIATGGK